MIMENEKYIYQDSSHETHEVVLKQNSFNFHQKEKELHDVAIKGKPTTFLKDALRRFVRNKSSVVASVILGILVLFALIVPFALPYDTSGASTGTTYLPPKLFEAGTGFWDGTKTYDNMVFNPQEGRPDGNFNSSAIIGDLRTYGGKLDNTPNQFASGGYIRVGSTGGSDYVWTNQSTSLDPTQSFSLSYTMDQGISSYDVVPYFIRLSYTTTNPDTGETSNNYIPLVENSSNFGTVANLDVTQQIQESTLTAQDSVQLQVGIQGSGQQRLEGVFLKDLMLSQNGTSIEAFSLSDANAALLNGTWKTSSAGQSGLSQADITYVSFTYDPYRLAYGDVDDIYTVAEMQNLIDQGYVSYDFNVGESSFQVLDDRSPVIQVTRQETISAAGITEIEVHVVISRYKQMGFTSMPLHIFGTDANGIDMFKYVAEGLRNSLLIAVGISLICIVFGLIYGSIEGYFGGYIDLFMERFVDILGNIPSLILITIFILHLGQGFLTFMLALCLTGWIGTAGLTRTQFYRFKRREYILAARSLGAKDGRLIFKHILPNAVGTIITSSVLIIPSVIFAEASIAYLGIGLTGLSSLGVILSENQINIQTNQYLLVFPSVILALLLICFNLMGNGLRDAFNPSTKGSD